MFPKTKNLTEQEQRILVQLFIEFLIDNNQKEFGEIPRKLIY